MEKLKNFLSTYENSQGFLLFVGLLAALFFSSTFLFNRAISLDGGHWYWSASLRFFFTVMFLSIGFIALKGIDFFSLILKEYREDFFFWSTAGSIGFGVFYSLICYASFFSPAWIVATTFQFTIIASLFVLSFFGQKLPKKIWVVTIVIFIGVTLVNVSHFDLSNIELLLLGAFPVLIAAFAFPIGNQMVWEKKKQKRLEGADLTVLKNPFGKVFLLILGSLPFWVILFLFVEPGAPTKTQYINVSLIALLAGIVATSLFLYARSHSNTSQKLVIVDSTQSGDVFFSLLGEILFLGVAFPNTIGLLGIAVTIGGLYILIKFK